MRKCIDIGVFLLMMLSILTYNGLAQSGDPPPPPPHGASPIDDSKQVSVIPDAPLVAYRFDLSDSNRLDFVYNAARALLENEPAYLIYQADALERESAGAPADYRWIAFTDLTDDFFAHVQEFLVTDGEKYFHIQLVASDSGVSSNAPLEPVGEE